jgi:hypothetical protein
VLPLGLDDELCKSAGGGIPAKIAGVLAGGGTHAPGQRSVGGELVQVHGQGRYIGPFESQAGAAVAHEFGGAAGAGDDRRQAGSHRLQGRNTHAFIIRGQHKDVCGGVVCGNLFARHIAGEL